MSSGSWRTITVGGPSDAEKDHQRENKKLSVCARIIKELEKWTWIWWRNLPESGKDRSFLLEGKVRELERELKEIVGIILIKSALTS